MQPGGKFPGGSPNIPKAPSYCCSAHPSVGQVGLYCRLSCVCLCIFLRDRQEVRSSELNGCCHDSMALPFEFLTARKRTKVCVCACVCRAKYTIKKNSRLGCVFDPYMGSETGSRLSRHHCGANYTADYSHAKRGFVYCSCSQRDTAK